MIRLQRLKQHVNVHVGIMGLHHILVLHDMISCRESSSQATLWIVVVDFLHCIRRRKKYLREMLWLQSLDLANFLVHRGAWRFEDMGQESVPRFRITFNDVDAL